jgi:hypothetical protein
MMKKHSLETSVSVFLSTRHHIAEDMNLHGCRCQNCKIVFVLRVSSFDSGSINIRPFYAPAGVQVLVYYSETLSNRERQKSKMNSSQFMQQVNETFRWF